ncbi:MAG TPA: Ig-like domain-containing domain [Candidatus Latescibacteria bacterium]|nr:Ig-like domain-containing domain [Candidatus Latescibacterota bacterium]
MSRKLFCFSCWVGNRLAISARVYLRIVPCLALCCAACARVGSPGGGPEDTIPPRVVRMAPEDSATRVSLDMNPRIEFSERMNKASADQAIFITPYPVRYPRFEWSRGDRVLTIRFEGGLEPQKTYVITIGTGVTDLHGVRLASAQAFAFSTGDSIHRGRVQGVVYDGRFVPTSGLTIGLFPLQDNPSPDPARDYAAYVTQSGNAGRFSIGYLPDGTYRLFAWRDANSDGLIDAEEPVGLASTDVVVKDGARVRIPSVCMGLSERTGPRLERIRALDATHVEMLFGEPVDSLRVEAVEPASGATPIECSVLKTPRASNRVVVYCSGLKPGAAYGAHVRAWDRAGNPAEWAADTTSFVASGQAVTMRLRAESVEDHRAISPDSPAGFSVWTNDLAVPATGFGRAFQDDGTIVEGAWHQRHANHFMFAANKLMGSRERNWVVPLADLRDDRGNPCEDSVRVTLYPAREDSMGEVSGVVSDSIPGRNLRVLLRKTEEGPIFPAVVSDSLSWHANGLPAGDYEVFAWYDEDGNGRWSPGNIIPFAPAERWAVFGTVAIRPRWTTAGVVVHFE